MITTKVINTDITLEIARGSIDNMSALTKFWLNPSVWTTEQALWDVWWPANFLDSASSLDVSSTSLDDSTWWTGARTLMIQGLDEDYNEAEETVNLNWTTVVNTVITFLRIHRIIVITAWSNWWAIWMITVKVAGVTYWQIDNGNNQSLMAMYTIPAWKTGYILYGKSSIWQWKEATIRFKWRPLWGVFALYHAFYIFENNYDYRYQTPLRVPEKTDLLVTGQVTLATTAISASFDIIIIDN